MKKYLIIGSIAIAAALGILLFASFYNPKVKTTAGIITPTPFEATAAPTPSPTPKIEILEDRNDENYKFLGFSFLLDYMTTSQYNYTMLSTTEFFNSLYQSSVRHYPFEQYKIQYDDMLSTRFSFANDDKIRVPFDRFNEVFIGDTQEYLFILDKESLQANVTAYTYTIEFLINSEQSATFDFVVNKKSSVIQIN